MILDKIRRIEIEINTHCNLQCSYCPNAQHERIVKGMLSEENFLKILQELKKYTYHGIITYHFYGEPLLHPLLEIFIKHTKDYLPDSIPVIYTNGILLNEDLFLSLVKNGVELFVITKQETCVTLPIDNFTDITIKKYASKIRFMKYTELVYTNRGGLVQRYNLKDQALPLDRICLIPSTSIVITYKGNVLPCFEDYYEHHIMGNIFLENLDSIWNSKKYKKFREDLQQGRRNKYSVCAKCDSLICIV